MVQKQEWSDTLELKLFEHLRIWSRGIDTTLFHPNRRNLTLRAQWLSTRTDLNEASQPVILLYVGRISWEKNLHLLIQAYQGMDHQRSHLVIGRRVWLRLEGSFF